MIMKNKIRIRIGITIFSILLIIFLVKPWQPKTPSENVATKSENARITKNLNSDTTSIKKIIPEQEEIIKYKVIVDRGTFNYRLSNGRTGVSTVKYIVVDKKSTQAEVKKLAEKLRLEYQSSDMILIPLLTSVIAAKNYDNWDYDNSDSWLALITKNYAQNTIQYQPAFYKLNNK